jgi:hypothetical protein
LIKQCQENYQSLLKWLADSLSSVKGLSYREWKMF